MFCHLRGSINWGFRGGTCSDSQLPVSHIRSHIWLQGSGRRSNLWGWQFIKLLADLGSLPTFRTPKKALNCCNPSVRKKSEKTTCSYGIRGVGMALKFLNPQQKKTNDGVDFRWIWGGPENWSIPRSSRPLSEAHCLGLSSFQQPLVEITSGTTI